MVKTSAANIRSKIAALNPARVDPGGVELTRGLHMILAVLISGIFVWKAPQWLGAPSLDSLILLCGWVSGACILFTPAGARKIEAVSIIRSSAIAAATLSLATFGDLILGPQLGGFWQLLFIPVIALALFMRAFGPRPMREGRIVALAYLFANLGAPDPTTEMLYPFAAIYGGAIALLVRMLVWRPHPLTIYRSLRRHFLRRIGHRLQQLPQADSDQERHALYKSLRQDWLNLNSAANNAIQAEPRLKDFLERQVSLSLRLSLSVQTIIDSMQELASPPETSSVTGTPCSTETPIVSTPFQPLLAPLFEGAATVFYPGLTNLPSRRFAILDDIDQLEQNIRHQKKLPDHQKFHILRIIVALERMLITLRDWSQTAKATVKSEETPLERTKKAPPAAGLSPNFWIKSRNGLRFAAQGAIAAALTIAITNYFELNHSYWAPLTVLIVLSSNVGQTWRRIVDRTLGTFVGVVIAILFIEAFSRSPGIEGLATLAAIAFILPYTVRYYGVASALIAFSVLAGLSTLVGIDYSIMIARIYETLLGASIGLLASRFIFPVFQNAERSRLLTDFISVCQKRLEAITQSQSANDVAQNALEAKANELLAILPDLRAEQLFLVSGPSQISAQTLSVHVALLRDYANLFASTCNTLIKNDPPTQMQNVVEKIQRLIDDAFHDTKHAAADHIALTALRKEVEAELDFDQVQDGDATMKTVEAFFFAAKLLTVLSAIERQDAERA